MPMPSTTARPDAKRSLIDILAEAAGQAAQASAPRHDDRSGLAHEVEGILRGAAARRDRAPADHRPLIERPVSERLPTERALPARQDASTRHVEAGATLPKLSDMKVLVEAIRIVGDMAETMIERETRPVRPVAMQPVAPAIDPLAERLAALEHRLDHISDRLDQASQVFTQTMGEVSDHMASLRDTLAHEISSRRQDVMRHREVQRPDTRDDDPLAELKALRDRLNALTSRQDWR